MCTFWTIPIITQKLTSPDPPYEMNGNGRP